MKTIIIEKENVIIKNVIEKKVKNTIAKIGAVAADIVINEIVKELTEAIETNEIVVTKETVSEIIVETVVEIALMIKPIVLMNEGEMIAKGVVVVVVVEVIVEEGTKRWCHDLPGH